MESDQEPKDISEVFCATKALNANGLNLFLKFFTTLMNMTFKLLILSLFSLHTVSCCTELKKLTDSPHEISDTPTTLYSRFAANSQYCGTKTPHAHPWECPD